MPFTIFFAWQMDRPTNVNRWFIERAIKIAIKQLKAEVRTEDDLKLEDALAVEPAERGATDPEPEDDDRDIVLQWGAQGKPGASLIAETILERIEECGVFIGDLSFVTTVKTADGRTKRMPNANVLIETGAAARTGNRWDRMILVLNNAFGTADELPFDLKHRHCTVQYDLKRNNDRKKAEKRNQLAKEIAAQIRPIYEAAMSKAIAEKKRRDDELAKAQAGRVKTIRNDFESAIKNDQFHTFRAQAAIMALSIISASETKRPVEYTRMNQQLFMRHLQLFGLSSGGIIRHVPRGVVSEFQYGDGKPPRAMTELREDGTVLAALNMIFGRDDICHFEIARKVDVTTKWVISMEEYQRFLFNATREYVELLKELGVVGPWFVGLSLLKTNNLLLIPTESGFGFYGRGDGKAYTGEDMKADCIIMPADADLSTNDAVEDLLQRPLKQIWRHCNYPSYPHFNGSGSYKWRE